MSFWQVFHVHVPAAWSAVQPHIQESLGLHGKQREPLIAEMGGELLGEEPARRLHVPLWTEPDLNKWQRGCEVPWSLRGGGKGRPEDILVSCTQSEGCGPLQGCPDLLSHSDDTFGCCLKYRGGLWCFLSHCSSSLHMPCHDLFVCIAVGNGVTSRSTLPDWRFHPSSSFNSLPFTPHS